MKKINLTIDEKGIRVREGTTILDAAGKLGIEIPSLCRIPDIKPSGSCRICVVEVAGARTLVGSCHTPVAEGMIVKTNTQKVRDARKAIIELMMASHSFNCVNDPNAGNCQLHNLADKMEVGSSRFKVRRPRTFSVENLNPYIIRDLSKCIMCRKCVIACNLIADKRILNIAYRGFKSKVTAGLDEPLMAEECRDCGICAEHCPTGALTRAGESVRENVR